MANLMQMLGAANQPSQPQSQSQQPHPNPMDMMMAGMMEEMAQNPELFSAMMAAHPDSQASLSPGAMQMAQNPEFLRMAAQMVRSGALQGMGGAGTGMGGMDTAMMEAMMARSMGGAPFSPTLAGSHPTMQPQPQQNPEERFQTQLQQLQDMGFWDKKSNIQALLISNGSVSQAIEYLLANPPQ